MAKRLRTAALTACLAACGAPAPAFVSDQADAEMYGQVLTAARRVLALADDVVVHPYLAVVRDSAGHPDPRLDEFEYEPAASLQLLQRADSTVVLCAYDAQGVCEAASYIVLSRLLRVAPRDGVIVVFAVVPAQAGHRPRYLLVRLKYGRGRWYVAGTRPQA